MWSYTAKKIEMYFYFHNKAKNNMNRFYRI
jgi:hypothetical protein